MDINKQTEALEAADLPFDKQAVLTMNGSPVRWISKSGGFLTLADSEGQTIGASVSYCREIGPNRYAMQVTWGLAGKDMAFGADDMTGVSMRHSARIVIEYPADVTIKKKSRFADSEPIALPEDARIHEPYAPPRTDISKRTSSVADRLRNLLGI